MVTQREQYGKNRRYFTKIFEAYQIKPIVRISLGVVFAFLTISFFGVFAIRPTVNTISELLSEIRSQEETAKKLDEKLLALSRARETWVLNEKRVSLVDQALPSLVDPGSFLQQFETLSATHSVSLRSFSVGQTVLLGKVELKKDKDQKAKKELTDVYEVSLAVSGEYQSLVSFVKDLLNMRRIILVDSVTIGVNRRDEKNPGALVLTVAGRVPYKKAGN